MLLKICYHREDVMLSIPESCPLSLPTSHPMCFPGGGSWNSPFIYAVYKVSSYTGLSILMCQVFLFGFHGFFNHLPRGPVPEEIEILKECSYGLDPCLC